MSSTPKHHVVRSLINVLFVAISLSAVLSTQSAQARTFSAEQIERGILGGFASNPAYMPGFYQVYSAATIRIQHTIKSLEGGGDEQTDVWRYWTGRASWSSHFG